MARGNYAAVPMTEIIGREVAANARATLRADPDQIARAADMELQGRIQRRSNKTSSFFEKGVLLLQEQDTDQGRAAPDQTVRVADLEAGRQDPEESSDKRPPAAASAKPASIR